MWPCVIVSIYLELSLNGCLGVNWFERLLMGTNCRPGQLACFMFSINLPGAVKAYLGWPVLHCPSGGSKHQPPVGWTSCARSSGTSLMLTPGSQLIHNSPFINHKVMQAMQLKFPQRMKTVVLVFSRSLMERRFCNIWKRVDSSDNTQTESLKLWGEHCLSCASLLKAH